METIKKYSWILLIVNFLFSSSYSFACSWVLGGGSQYGVGRKEYTSHTLTPIAVAAVTVVDGIVAAVSDDIWARVSDEIVVSNGFGTVKVKVRLAKMERYAGVQVCDSVVVQGPLVRPYYTDSWPSPSLSVAQEVERSNTVPTQKTRRMFVFDTVKDRDDFLKAYPIDTNIGHQPPNPILVDGVLRRADGQEYPVVLF